VRCGVGILTVFGAIPLGHGYNILRKTGVLGYIMSFSVTGELGTVFA
jgi:hypothetical protein